MVDVERQSHAAVDAHLPKAGGLEAELDEPRSDGSHEFGRMVIGCQVLGEQADHLLAIPPSFLNYLVSRAVEVELVNVSSIDAAAFRVERRCSFNRGLGPRQENTCGEMSCCLGLLLIGERPVADQTALSDELIAPGLNDGFDSHRTRLVAVELEGREEADFFDRFDVPPRE